MFMKTHGEQSMIKAIFWDNDGVLVDTETLYFEANQTLFNSFGIDITRELYIENYLQDNRGCWHLLPDGLRRADVLEDLREKRNKIYKDLINNNDIGINGAGDVLASLYKKVIMAAVSSSRKAHFDFIHSKTGFMKYFDFVILREDCKNSKPDPEPYLKAIAKSGMRREECLVVEDSRRGLLSAKSAGLECWVIPTELTKDSDFSEADRILSSIVEIPEILSHQR